MLQKDQGFYFPVKQVFKDLDFLGWYTTGDGVNEKDIRIHKQVNIKSKELSRGK